MTYAVVGARDRVQLALWLVAVGAWFVIMLRFGHGDVYTALGPLACAIVVLVSWLQREHLAAWFAPRARAIAIGIGVGVAMTALTYPVFRLARSLVPSLGNQVQVLYAGAHSDSIASALAWVISVILAEELLFRGALPDVLAHWLPERAAFGASLALYTIAQLGTGSAIVTLLAFVCGSIWTAQRMLTNSVLSSLLAHLIWTPIVLVLLPVT